MNITASPREDRRAALALDRQPEGQDQQAEPDQPDRLEQENQLVQIPLLHQSISTPTTDAKR
ncbi:MAG: hypothetical protein WDN28_27630 [Chthoniobacter sp.]